MKIIDNKTSILGDDLKKTIKAKSKISVSSPYFQYMPMKEAKIRFYQMENETQNII